MVIMELIRVHATDIDAILVNAFKKSIFVMVFHIVLMPKMKKTNFVRNGTYSAI